MSLTQSSKPSRRKQPGRSINEPLYVAEPKERVSRKVARYSDEQAAEINDKKQRKKTNIEKKKKTPNKNNKMANKKGAVDTLLSVEIGETTESGSKAKVRKNTLLLHEPSEEDSDDIIISRSNQSALVKKNIKPRFSRSGNCSNK